MRGEVVHDTAYDNQGRLKYSPDLHDQHLKPYSEEDLAYMCAMHGKIPLEDLGLALGRTGNAVSMKLTQLKKRGLYEHYRKLGAM